MGNWILVIFAYAGYTAVAVTEVAGFQNEAYCEAAGKKVQNTRLQVRYNCLDTGRVKDE